MKENKNLRSRIHKKFTTKDVDRMISIVQESIKSTFTISNLVDMGIFYNNAQAANLKRMGGGPKYFQSKMTSITYYNKESVIKWLKEIKINIRNSVNNKNITSYTKSKIKVSSFEDFTFQETIEDVDKKINSIKKARGFEFNNKELIKLGIFYSYSHSKWLKRNKLLNAYQYIERGFYYYKKDELLNWLNTLRDEKLGKKITKKDKEPEIAFIYDSINKDAAIHCINKIKEMHQSIYACIDMFKDKLMENKNI